VWCGVARFGFFFIILVSQRQSEAGLGAAMPGEVRLGEVGLGQARYGAVRQGVARWGKARPGVAWLGLHLIGGNNASCSNRCC
jgi:hypothetical protein